MTTRCWLTPALAPPSRFATDMKPLQSSLQFAYTIFPIGLGFIYLLTMPAQARQVMSVEAYQAFDHEEPYIYQLDFEPGACLYFGSRHSFDPTDVQMERLEAAWSAFQADVVFAEGGPLEIESLAQDEAIRRYGEFGMTAWLATRDSIPVQSLDPERAEEIAHLQEQGWSDEQLMLFFTLRQVVQSQKRQDGIDLANAAPQYLNSLVERFSLRGPTTLDQFEEAVGRLLPDLADWKTISDSYLYPGPQEPSYFTNEISTKSNQFRDQFHVGQLKAAILSGKRVFAIAGSAHAVMQEPALRAMLTPR